MTILIPNSLEIERIPYLLLLYSTLHIMKSQKMTIVFNFILHNQMKTSFHNQHCILNLTISTMHVSMLAVLIDLNQHLIAAEIAYLS